MHPDHPNDIVCDTCPARAPWMGSKEATEDSARFKGWRLFDGVSLTGAPMRRACCPGCGSNAVPRPPSARAVMEGQLEFPGLALPVPGGKKKRGGKREMS